MEDVWILEIQHKHQRAKKRSTYSEKVKSPPVYEFNHTQKEVGLDTISNQNALNWLKAERPKTAIYPH